MNPALLRQDPAFRGASRWLTLIMGMGVALLAALSMLLYAAAARGTPPNHGVHFVVAFTVIWFAMAVSLLGPGVRTRASHFTLGLPVDARAVWTLHQVAVLLSSLSVWAILVGVLMAGNRIVSAFGGPELLPSRYALDLLIALPAGFTLVIAILQAPARELRTLPFGRSYVGRWVLTVAGVLAATLALASFPLPLVTVLPAAAVGIWIWNRGRVPPAFLVAPREAVPTPVASARSVESAGSYSGPAYQWFLFRTVQRATMKKAALPLLGYPVLLILGAQLAGVTAAGNEDGALRFDLIIITAYMILAFFGGLTKNLQRVDSLPISRRRLLAMFMLPSALALVAGYGAGLAVNAIRPPRELMRLHQTECCGVFLGMPTARCEIAWDGRVPGDTAPWGESHPDWSVPLYRGSRAVLYSPFSSAEPASPRYVARQISRATEAVYRRAIPEEEIASRYLRTGASETAIPVASGMSLQADHPGLRPRSSGPAFPILMALVCVPGFLFCAFYLRSFRAQRTESSRKYALWGLLLVLLLAHMGQYVLFVTRFMRTWVYEGLFEIGIRKAGEAFPGSTWAAWLLSGILIYLSYRAVERAFERIEIATRAGD